jgi:hypothetical protein
MLPDEAHHALLEVLLLLLLLLPLLPRSTCCNVHAATSWSCMFQEAIKRQQHF